MGVASIIMAALRDRFQPNAIIHPMVCSRASVINQLQQTALKAVMQRLVGPKQLQGYSHLDWPAETSRFSQPELPYPDYYTQPNFHGIANGYLNPIAAITYDAVTALASPPNERWVRQQLIHAISSTPQTILDMGCGTGSTTVMLKQRFPNATVTGLDLSPYMLVVADRKAQTARADIHWQVGMAEATPFKRNTFDLITLAFLLHETPPTIAQRILQEGYRLLKPGGQMVILDGSQKVLRRATWLIRLFREPYSQVYAAGDVDTWLTAAGFTAPSTRFVGWIHQVSQAIKPT